MNLCLFFEGAGHGVAGKITNVTYLRDKSPCFCSNFSLVAVIVLARTIGFW